MVIMNPVGVRCDPSQYGLIIGAARPLPQSSPGLQRFEGFIQHSCRFPIPPIACDPCADLAVTR